jgi:hypothetical protein
MAKYNGSGWHSQSVRHSNARRTGKAGGLYAINTAKTFQGAIEVSAMQNGHRVHQQYMGYSKKEALSKFKRDNKDTDRDGVPDKYDCQPKNPKAQADYKTFQIGDGYEIIAHWEKTRNGFRHMVTLMKDGNQVDQAKETYLNRTWESYEFETAIKNLLDKAVKNKEITIQQKDMALARAEGKSKEETDRMFKTTAMVAQMGEFFGKTQKDKNDWKKRMLKAGMPGLDIPEDWDKLSEDEKETRLNKVIEGMKKP